MDEKLPLNPLLATYKSLLLKWAKVINLVSPATLADVDARHFQDSLQLIPLLPAHTKILFDLGSGAGFPGLVIALERPDIRVHLFESDTKKCSFLSTVSRETHIPVVIHNHRIESVDKIPDVVPDVISARALASLDNLLALTEVWWSHHPQVTLLFPKGAKADDEIATARELYDFTLETFPSQTEKNARILRITHVKRRPRF